jgi:shikimate dehydrogenase
MASSLLPPQKQMTGMLGRPVAENPIDRMLDTVYARPCLTGVDVITNPRFTHFLRSATERDCAVVDGVEMLVQLAMQLFESWTGVTPEEDVFQRAVSAALGE